MTSDTLINIAKIIERDNKSSTYKFALLRGTIDIIQDNSPYIKKVGNRVFFPMGLMINKWIFYYYPLIANPNLIPQINSTKGISFETELSEIIEVYEKLGGGMSLLYNDIRLGKYEEKTKANLLKLHKKLKDTIAGMPMKHLGYSIYRSHYSIFQYHPIKINSKGLFPDLINGYGDFSIPSEYYDALKLLGSFITGQDSIISKWADFSFYSGMNKNVNKSEIINKLLDGPITERDVKESKNYYRKLCEETGNVVCVWTGKSLTNFDIDHLIPFSVWKNNDLWNLLPSSSTINNRKRDRIPSTRIIENSAERIIANWELLIQKNSNRFQREIENGLLGQPIGIGWQEMALNRLMENVDYLINKRGYDEWKI